MEIDQQIISTKSSKGVFLPRGRLLPHCLWWNSESQGGVLLQLKHFFLQFLHCGCVFPKYLECVWQQCTLTVVTPSAFRWFCFSATRQKAHFQTDFPTVLLSEELSGKTDNCKGQPETHQCHLSECNALLWKPSDWTDQTEHIFWGD